METDAIDHGPGTGFDDFLIKPSVTPSREVPGFIEHCLGVTYSPIPAVDATEIDVPPDKRAGWF